VRAQTRYRIANLKNGHRTDIPFMKQTIEEQSDSPMRFFTPELYLRYASDEDDVANAANEEWESALLAYQHHLKRVMKKADVPAGIVRLPMLSLHDATVVGYPRSKIDSDNYVHFGGPLPWALTGFLLGLDTTSGPLILAYHLWESVKIYISHPWRPRRSGQQVYCLYDELDEVSHGRKLYFHRILMSNGEVLEIPLQNVHYFRFSRRDRDETGDVMPESHE
jgi:hypothetical protein